MLRNMFKWKNIKKSLYNIFKWSNIKETIISSYIVFSRFLILKIIIFVFFDIDILNVRLYPYISYISLVSLALFRLFVKRWTKKNLK